MRQAGNQRHGLPRVDGRLPCWAVRKPGPVRTVAGLETCCKATAAGGHLKEQDGCRASNPKKATRAAKQADRDPFTQAHDASA